MKPITKKPLKPASQRPAPKKPVGATLSAMAKKIAAGEKGAAPKAKKAATTTEHIAEIAEIKTVVPMAGGLLKLLGEAPATQAATPAILAAYEAGDVKGALKALQAALRADVGAHKAEPKARAMTAIQQTFVDLCSREQGATAKELAAAAGWPTIAARTTLTKLADRFGYKLTETPRALHGSITFRLAKITAPEA